LKKILLAVSVCLGLGLPAFGGENSVTIPLVEYEKLKDLEEAKSKNQFWKMTFEQILEEKNGNVEAAWKIYDYYVLRNIYLNNTVTRISVDKLINDIRILNQLSPGKPITIKISSWGGSVFDGLRLYNSMMSSTSPVYTVCDGMAVSMAAVIMAAGDYRVAHEGCSFMVHQITAGAPGGNTIEQIVWAETILDVENMLLGILSKHSGLSPKDVRTLGEYETFYDADEIVRLGFADVSTSFTSTEEEIRTIPEDLLPLNRIRENLNERLAE
jgi:ATP-dependent Clp protease protease subunit